MAPMALGLGLGATFGGGIPSLAAMLLAAETDGLAADFTDMSMVVKDTATPANAFSGDPNSKLTYSSPSTKWILGSNGRYSSGTTLRTEYNTSGVALGCRIEEARTNLALRSQEMDNASWPTSSTTVTADQITAPDGATTADLLTATATSATRIRQSFSLTAASTYTASVFVKKGTSLYLCIDITDSAPRRTWFDITAGTVGTNAAGSTATIEAYPNGWYRCSVTRAVDQISCFLSFYYSNADNSLNQTNGATVYLWQGQLELGTFPTSPIVTAGSTVTRAADPESLATSLFNWSATAATLYAKFRPLNVAAERRALQLDDGTANEVLTIGSTSGAACFLQVTDGGAAQTAPLTSGTVTTAAFERLAVSIAANAFALTSDGAAQVTDTSGTLPTVTTLRFGAGVSGATSLNGHLAQVMVLPRTSTEAQLQGYGA